MTEARAITWVALASWCASCSAMGLGDYELVDCDPDPSVCEALNEALPADACRRYTCSPSGYGCVIEPLDYDGDGFYDRDVCADEVDEARLDCDDRAGNRYPGNAEECDSVDNNCDGYIDEGLASTNGSRDTLSTGNASFEEVAHTVSSDGTLHVALTVETGHSQFQTQHVALLDDFQGPEPMFVRQECEGATGHMDCQISQLALASTDETVVGAGIHGLGCGAGQLRIGAGRRSDFGLVLGGNGKSGLGVDLEEVCTRSSPSCPGAQAPAVAALSAEGADRAEALFVWLAPIADDPEQCRAASEFQISALAVPILEDVEPRLLLGADFASDPLGEQIAIGPPAAIASPSAQGFFVAYPSREGIELLFVPRSGERSSVSSQLVTTTVEARAAANVAVALGDRELAVTYRSSVEGTAALELAVMAVEGEGAPDALAELHTVALAAEGEIVAGPSIAHAASGFVDEKETGQHGGWLVTWVERDGGVERLIGARIAEAGARVLNERIELSSESAREPFTYSKQDGDNRSELRAGYLTDDKLHVRTVSCRIAN